MRKIAYGYPVKEGETYIRDMNRQEVEEHVVDMIESGITEDVIIQFVLTWADMQRGGK